MGQKALEESYGFLLGLGIMMDVETLKCDSQWPNSMHTLAILMNFLRHTTSLTNLLRCFYDSLSGPGVSKLLYFVIALINSSSENELYFVTCLLENFSSKSKSIW